MSTQPAILPPSETSGIDLDLGEGEPQVSTARSEQIVELDPNTVFQSPALPNRHSSAFENDTFIELQESIRRLGGNTEPIKVQRSASNSEQYEIVYGHRRWEACRRLGIAVRAIVTPRMQATEVLLERVAENSGRAEFSPFEFGRICLKLSDSGRFLSQRQLAIELAKDQGLVSKALQLVKLPKEILAALPSPNEVTYRQIKPLCDACDHDPERAIAVARELSAVAGRTTADVLKQLMGAPIEPFNADTTRRPLRVHGKEIGTLALDAKGRAAIKFTRTFEPAELDALESAIVALLANGGSTRRIQRKEASQ